MIKKLLTGLEKCLRYLMTLTIIPFSKTLINIIKDGVEKIDILDKIIIFLFPGMVIIYILTLFLTHYFENKDIYKTPLNDNSAKKLNCLLNCFYKSVKKLEKNLKTKEEFVIKFPKYDFSKNKLYKKANIIRVTPNNKKQIVQEICNDIISLKRTLLEINKSDLRIKLGQFLVNNTTDSKQEIEGYIDFLGWTRLLNGNKKGINDIKKGIEICERKMNTCLTEGNIDEVNNYIFNIVRGYRHLGTTYYTYKFDPNMVENSINLSYNYLSKIDNNKNVDAEKYTKLAVGIKYNSILFKYYESIYDKTSNCNLNNIKQEIKKLYESVYGINKISIYNAIDIPKLNQKYLDIKYIDNHRKIKICSLYSILFEDKESVEALKEVESILNHNIYIDEAVELYIYDKLNNIK